jgi:hypothetical protein
MGMCILICGRKMAVWSSPLMELLLVLPWEMIFFYYYYYFVFGSF